MEIEIRSLTLAELGEMEREKAKRKRKGEVSENKLTGEKTGPLDLVKDGLCQ